MRKNWIRRKVMKQLGELGDMDRNAQKAVEITG